MPLDQERLRCQEVRRRRSKPRRVSRLAVDLVLFGVVQYFLQEGWSPGQMAVTLNLKWPDALNFLVTAETIYTRLHDLPRGGSAPATDFLPTHGAHYRLPRSHGMDWRGQLPNMLSFYFRPVEVMGHALPGHWEGNFIKGTGNLSPRGVLIERHSRLVPLAKMDDATTASASALAGYSRRLNSLAPPMRQSLTHDQRKEMAN